MSKFMARINAILDEPGPALLLTIVTCMVCVVLYGAYQEFFATRYAMQAARADGSGLALIYSNLSSGQCDRIVKEQVWRAANTSSPLYTKFTCLQMP